MISQNIDGGATEADGGASAPENSSVATPPEIVCLGIHVLRCMHGFVFWAFCVCKMFIDVCLRLCTYVWQV